MYPERGDEAAAARDVDDGQPGEPPDEADARGAEEKSGDHAPLAPADAALVEHRERIG